MFLPGLSSQQVWQLKKELKEARDQNQVLTHEKLVLAQEKAQLYGRLTQLGVVNKKSILRKLAPRIKRQFKKALSTAFESIT